MRVPSLNAFASLPLCVVGLLLGSQARAEMGEWQLSLGGDYRALILTGDPDDVTVHVPGLEGGLWYGLDDYWQVGGSLQLGVAVPPREVADPAPFGTGALEVRYVLDIVEWVPHLTAGVGVMWDGVGEDIEMIVGVGGGLDYRWSRELSVGVDLRYDFVVTALDAVTATFHAALVVSSHFE